MFVDISGFTALSLRLKVEDLKNHINDYFTNMLNIVDRWDGDVIKFAGDALYVIWKTELAAIVSEGEDDVRSVPSQRHYSMNFSNEGYGKAAIRAALEKAIACGLEINATCGNHEVQLDSPAVEQVSSNGIISKFLPRWARMAGNKVSPTEGANPNVAYLNVHSGVSFGLMGGVDIGAEDRWEYFLIGEPLHKVAECEEEAKKGDVVICPESHQLVHGSILQDSNSMALSEKMVPMLAATSMELPCGCCQTPKGYFKISNIDTRSPRNKAVRMKRTRSRARIDDNAASAADTTPQTHNFRIYDDCNSEIDKLYGAIQNALKVEVTNFINRTEVKSRMQSHHADTPSSPSSLQVTSNNLKPKERDRMVLDILSNDLKKHVTDWLQYCVLEDFVKHVHEVARDDYYYDAKPRSTAFRVFLESISKRKNNDVRNIRPSHDPDDEDGDSSSPPPINHRPSLSEAPPKGLSMKGRNHSLNGAQFNALIKKASSKYLVQEAALSAEIRNVMVLFIKIDGLDMELIVDDICTDQQPNPSLLLFAHNQFGSVRAANGGGPNPLRMSGGNGSLRSNMVGNSAAARAVGRGASIGATFDFLDRTDNEVVADKLMLERVQNCIQVLCKVFADARGQMRQFIVDDKGTVCIGTFGLKGSVEADSAAMALETAKNIVIQLQGLGLTASIGITSGKAYCGLVGSPARHEYAVMGPSTNLSARLMCKAPAFGVICDTETKNRDRTHGFESLSEVAAKGYATPVMTYKPIFEDILHLLTEDVDSQLFEALSPNKLIASKTYSNLRVSTDWYNNMLARSSSVHFRQSIDSAHGSLKMGNTSSPKGDRSIDLSGRYSTRLAPKASQTPSHAVFSKRRKSIRDAKLLKDELLKMNSEKFKLYGREEEMNEILSFLFPTAHSHSNRGSFISMTGSLNSRTHSIMPLLTKSMSGLSRVECDASTAARMVVICGAEGTGKSALVDAIAKKVYVASKISTKFRIYSFRNRQSSFEMSVPFYSFKPIIQEMLVRVDHVMKAMTHSGHGHSASLKSQASSQMLKLTMNESILSGLSIIFPSLPTEMQGWRPLLASVSIISHEDDNEETELLKGRERISCTVELLVAMIGLFPMITKTSMLLIIEEMQSLDSGSRQVLLQVWRNCVGVRILGTQRQTPSKLSASMTSTGPLMAQNSLSNLRSTLGLVADPLEEDFPSESMRDNQPDLFEAFDDNKAFKIVELRGLGPDDTKALILDAIPDRLKGRIEDAFINKLCDASGGHPLYAYELTRNLVDKIRDDTSSEELLRILAELGVGVASNRIEEMICYRFDQLESFNQTILKAAAVACSNGAPFTLEMLISVLLDNEDLVENHVSSDSYDRRSEDYSVVIGANSTAQSVHSAGADPYFTSDGVRDVVEAILQRGEFIQICAAVTDVPDTFGESSIRSHAFSSSMAPSIRRRDSSATEKESPSRRPFQPALGELLPTTKLEFKIVLEQITIYNLLVDDQREYLHKRVACFYEEKLPTFSLVLDHDGYLCGSKEIAHHWQHASEYVKAMKAYYSLANIYKEDKDHLQYNAALHSAYSMFLSLKQDYSVGEYNLCTSKDLSEAFRTASNTYSSPKVIGDDESKGSESAHSTNPWDQVLLYNIFNGDIEDVRIAIRIHHSLALNELLSFEHPKFILPVLEECIRIMLVLCTPHILAPSLLFNSLARSSTTSSGRIIDRETSSRRLNSSSRRKRTGSSFYLDDYSAFAPPILFIYVLAGSFVENKSCASDPLFHGDAFRGKSRLVLEELEKILSSASSSSAVADGPIFGERFAYYNAQVLCEGALLHLAERKFSAAEEIVLRMVSHESFHEAVPIEWENYFGVNIAGYTLSLLGENYILRGEIVKGQKMVSQAVDLMTDMHLPASGTMTVLPTIAALQLLHDYNEALRVLDLYESLFLPTDLLAQGCDNRSNAGKGRRQSATPFSEKASLLSLTSPSGAALAAANSQPIVGLRYSFLQKIRVWLMCDRNQNSSTLDLAQRITAFSQLNNRLHTEVIQEIIHPQVVDGRFWPDFLMQCGLSLPAITAMIFCCYEVMCRGMKLRWDDSLSKPLQEYRAKCEEEYHVLSGYASTNAKIYFYHANIKIVRILTTMGLHVRDILLQEGLEQLFFKATDRLLDAKQRLAAALVANLTLQVSRSNTMRSHVLVMQRSALDAIIDLYEEETESNSENNRIRSVLQRKNQTQLWLSNQRIV